jgi:hypothetical protein
MYHEFTTDDQNHNKFLQFDSKEIGNYLWVRIRRERRESDLYDRYFSEYHYSPRDNSTKPAVFRIIRSDYESRNRVVCSVYRLSSGALGGESFKLIDETRVFFGAELPPSILLSALGGIRSEFHTADRFMRRSSVEDISEAAQKRARESTRLATKVAELDSDLLKEVAELFETPEAAAHFLMTPLWRLGGKSPAEVAQDREGKVRISGVLDSVRSGGYYWDRDV